MESVSPTVSTTSGKRGATEQTRGNSNLIIVISAVGCLALVTVVAVLCCAFLLPSGYKPGKPGQPTDLYPPPPPGSGDPKDTPDGGSNKNPNEGASGGGGSGPGVPPNTGMGGRGPGENAWGQQGGVPPNTGMGGRGPGENAWGQQGAGGGTEDLHGAGGGTWAPRDVNIGFPEGFGVHTGHPAPHALQDQSGIGAEDGRGALPSPPAGVAPNRPAFEVMEPSTRPPKEYSRRYFLPKVDRTVLLHGPSSQPGGYTPLYDANPDRVFCTVVAGTDTLGITGAGVNGVMANLLVQQSQGELSFERLRATTELLHRRAVERARRIPGTVYEMVTKDSKLYERLFSFCEEDIHPLRGVEETVGVAILGLLRQKYHIFGNPKNKYVLYIVAPKGKAPDPDFTRAYTATWRNLLLLVLLINRLHRDKKIDKIEQIRMPLLSGGIYLDKRRPGDLARDAVEQLLPLAHMSEDDVLLDFAYDSNNSFFTAVRDFGG